MISPARVAAYEVLRLMNGGRADLPAALARARSTLHDERDRALAGEIATGTLRWQAAFDHVIASFAKRPTHKLDPEILDLLRMSMFQVLHLTRVPASAAVDDAVNLAKRAGKRSAAPLVNAVLRRVSREREKLPLPPRDSSSRDASLAYLSATLSHPKWLVARWFDRFGFDRTEAWCQFNNAPAALTIRANGLKTTTKELADALERQGVSTRSGSFAPDALIVENGNPLRTELANTGAFVVQDEASQVVAFMADVRRGERVLDACASPGGKTTAMASAMEDEGTIVAMDVRPRRVRLLADTVARSGAKSIRVVQADASLPVPFSVQFDCVFVDAPCSGLGTLRRDPDIKWRRQPDDLPAAADFQGRLLEALSDRVRPGGRLVYATCSSEPDENDEVIERFLQKHREFRTGRPARIPSSIEPLLEPSGYLRTLPFRDGLEGFFAAVLVRAC